MNIQAPMLARLYSASVHTSELQAVMTILPPRFSCAPLLNVLLLGGGESDYVQRLDRGGGVDINLKENLSYPKNLCITRCITSRTVDHSLQAMEFLTKSHMLFVILGL